ncbi:hypothetical protein Tco_1096174, partial [Tanacetum coccineum]
MVEKPVLNNKERVTGQRKIRPVWNNAQRVNHQNKLTHPHPKRNFVPTAGQVPVNAAKQSSPRAAAAASISTGNPQYALQDQGIFNSECSRHMTGNKSYLTDYQEIDGGFVAFEGNAKGVSHKCVTRKTVFFLLTLNVLVLSPHFKLPDESQVLLKVPRNNMYSFDLKNVVPLGVVEGEGSGQPYNPNHYFSTAPPSHEEQVTTVASQSKKTHTPRRAKKGQDTEIPHSSGPPKKVGDEAVYTGEDDRVVRVATTATSLEAGKCVSDEGRPNRNELIAICTNLSNMVLALKTSKTAQDLVIKKLKKKVKSLEKKQRAKTPEMKLFKIGTSKRKSLDKENVSKQGRNLKTMLMFKEGDFDDDFDDIDDMVNEAMENVEGDIVNASGAVNTATATTGVSAASALVGVSISTAEPRTPPTTTTTAFEDEDLT